LIATPAFPSWVKFWPSQQNYQEQTSPNQAAFQPSTGNPILRRRTLLSQKLITFTLPLSAFEWEEVKTFYRGTIKDGTLQFTMPHPRTGVAATWAWVPNTPPSVSQTDGINFFILLTLRLISGGVGISAGHPVARAMIALEPTGGAIDFGSVTTAALGMYDDFGIIGIALDAGLVDLGHM
jgi:hypothetical protein